MLDLDETLLHSSVTPIDVYDLVFPVHFNAAVYQARTPACCTCHPYGPRACAPLLPRGLRCCCRQVYVRKRPHMEQFLARVSELFEVAVFTASQKVYADPLLSIIDPKRQWCAAPRPTFSARVLCNLV